MDLNPSVRQELWSFISVASLFKGSGISLLLVIVLAFPGCGAKPNYAVRGSVTLDGKPLPEARVTFLPRDSNGTAAMAITDPQGLYQLEQGFNIQGAAAGEYKVTITTFVDGDPFSDPPVPPIPEKVPDRYNLNSELSAKIISGENVFDFPLTSKK